MTQRGEFAFIAQSLAPLSAGYDGAFGLTDDAAALQSRAGLVVSSDTLVEGVHFRTGDPPGLIAQKAVRVNISDLVAMAAAPHAIMLSIVWPDAIEPAFRTQFVTGLAEDLNRYELPLIGGDTTRGGDRLVVTVTAFGEADAPLRRTGAQPGDGLFVTGCIGDAWLGLHADALGLSGSTAAFLEDRYLRPDPPVAFVEALSRLASAGLDISDGLVADAGHLSTNSEVQLAIELDQISVSDAAEAWLESLQNRNEGLIRLITGGDDYQMLFTAAPETESALMAAAPDAGIKLTRIGVVQTGHGAIVKDKAGKDVSILQTGFTHF